MQSTRKPAPPQPDRSLDIDLAATLAESQAMSKKITPASGPWDVIIVGSGAAGGMAAFQLATAGIKVLVLEAGRMLDWQKEYRTMEWPYQSLRRQRMPPDMRSLNVADDLPHVRAADQARTPPGGAWTEHDSRELRGLDPLLEVTLCQLGRSEPLGRGEALELRDEARVEAGGER